MCGGKTGGSIRGCILHSDDISEGWSVITACIKIYFQQMTNKGWIEMNLFQWLSKQKPWADVIQMKFPNWTNPLFRDFGGRKVSPSLSLIFLLHLQTVIEHDIVPTLFLLEAKNLSPSVVSTGSRFGPPADQTPPTSNPDLGKLTEASCCERLSVSDSSSVSLEIIFTGGRNKERMRKEIKSSVNKIVVLN
jgi:hypothetical protein